MSHGELEVKPPEAKPPQGLVEAPQPKPINYQSQADTCKACGQVAGSATPFLVLKMVTANEGGAMLTECYSHVGCVGILLQMRPRSLFQVKYSNGKETL